MNDQELESTVQEAQQGSREALNKVTEWFLNQDAFFDCAYRILRNYEDAREVIQDAAIKVYLKISTYNPRRASFKTWCYTVVKHAALDLLRKTDRDTIKQISSSTSRSPQKDREEKELSDIFDEAEENAGLSERERKVWRLYRAGDDNSTIAGILGITNRQVERAKHRAREKIKRYIDTNYPDFRI